MSLWEGLFVVNLSIEFMNTTKEYFFLIYFIIFNSYIISIIFRKAPNLLLSLLVVWLGKQCGFAYFPMIHRGIFSERSSLQQTTTVSLSLSCFFPSSCFVAREWSGCSLQNNQVSSMLKTSFMANWSIFFFLYGL